MSLPPSSFELIARAHRITTGFHARVRGAVAGLPGNPGRVSVRRFGGVWATRCELADAPFWMNLVAPVSAADTDVLDEALAWFGRLRPMFEVTPQPDGDRLGLALARRGAVAYGQLDILRGSVSERRDGGGALPLVERVDAGDAMLFARTLLSGHVETFWDHEAQAIASLAGSENVTCYMARVDGEPAAAAILAYDDGLAYLANASTLPAFRNRGCHGALLHARLDDAVRAGYDEVIALAAIGSTSHRNMERRGLHTLASITQWRFPAE